MGPLSRISAAKPELGCTGPMVRAKSPPRKMHILEGHGAENPDKAPFSASAGTEHDSSRWWFNLGESARCESLRALGPRNCWPIVDRLVSAAPFHSFCFRLFAQYPLHALRNLLTLGFPGVRES